MHALGGCPFREFSRTDLGQIGQAPVPWGGSGEKPSHGTRTKKLENSSGENVDRATY